MKARASILTWIIVIFILLAAAWYFGVIDLSKWVKKPQAIIEEEGKVALELPVKLIFIDTVAGSTVTPTSVELYDPSGRLLESISPSGGVAVSNLPYKSGEKIVALIKWSNNVFYTKVFTIPYYDKYVVSSQPSYHTIRLEVIKPPSSLSIKVYDSEGNLVSTAVNITTTGTITVSVINSEADTGLHDPFIYPITKTQYVAGLLIKITGSTGQVPMIKNAQLLYSGQGIAVYYIPLPKLICKTDKVTGAVVPASQSWVLTIDGTGLAGNSYTLTITAYTDLDPAYVTKAVGNANADAVSLGSVSFTVNIQ